MFALKWLDSAMDELADIYAPADPDQRKRILAAVTRIDKALRARGPKVGESRPRGYRIAHARPLGILFKMDASNTLVRIERVWWYDRRRR